MLKPCFIRSLAYKLPFQDFKAFSKKIVKMEVKRTQPQWKLPEGAYVTGLKLNNSLTRNKELFIPREGRKVQWYSCGPTVYDDSHMGHARSYISFDIMRRILAEYFHYDVNYVMNITDIDDKIIRRARRNHLFEEYRKVVQEKQQVLTDLQAALKLVKDKVAKETDADKLKMLTKTFDGAVIHSKNTELNTQELLSGVSEVLSDWLDEERGGSVVGNGLFEALPRHFEEKFHQDMDALNVRRADVVTRVSEFIPQIVSYVQQIIEKGYAYESRGSVYFSTGTFDDHPDHHYAKLVPEACGDAKALEEGEGSLSVSNDKRSSADFALWKSSKQGEPSWPSPWGMGRPGWHIECSVMASCVLGSCLDIHTGGIDLKFPHHDNELAQSEAYYDVENWVNYFLHSGHLTIEGCKMSKSLKNFITIRSALQAYSSRQLRLLFLLHGWDQPLDYSDSSMRAAIALEKTFNEFFLTVKELQRRVEREVEVKQACDVELRESFKECKVAVHKALCDNLNTRASIEAMRRLVSQANIHLKEATATATTSSDVVCLGHIAAYATAVLKIYGAIDDCESDKQRDLEEVLMPYLEAFVSFRDDVIKHATKLQATELLKACDEVRDAVLAGRLGVSVEDQEGGAVVKLVGVALMRAELEAKMEKNQKLEMQHAEKIRVKRQQMDSWKVPREDVHSQETAEKFYDDVCSDLESPTIGFPVEGIPRSMEEMLLPYLEAFAEFRDVVREAARKRKATELLKACDEVRDAVLAGRLGVSVEDQEGGAVVKLVGVALMRAELEAKMEVLRLKEEQRIEKLAQQRAKLEAYKVPPAELFRSDSALYSAFDDKGIPTHDAAGEVIGKSQLKRLQKTYDAHTKKHTEYLKSLQEKSF